MNRCEQTTGVSPANVIYVEDHQNTVQNQLLPNTIRQKISIEPFIDLETCEKLAWGKTKIIYAHPNDPTLAIIQSKDDITAGNGKKHDVIKGKAKLATQTTCNVFRLLQLHGLPVAFREKVADTVFIADKCDMISYEVVVRAEAHGSYLQRNCNVLKGHVFDEPIVEFFLKTTGKQWKDISLPKDDPYIIFKDKKIELYEPDLLLETQLAP